MVKKIVLECIAVINEELENNMLDNIDDKTPLFALLDSVTVLDLILELESSLELKYGRYIQVADEKSMDAINTPFKTVASLVDFLEGKVSD